MKKKNESFYYTRIANVVLGFVILGLILAVLYKESGTEIFEVLIFGLAAVMNFISATISFSEQKKLRGNICAVICAVVMVAAIFMAAYYFIFS